MMMMYILKDALDSSRAKQSCMLMIISCSILEMDVALMRLRGDARKICNISNWVYAAFDCFPCGFVCGSTI